MCDRGTYDVAVSFAGAQRDLVEHYVRACEALGLRVFYDKNVTARMWGRNFVVEFRRIYGQGIARYVVPFLSREYLGGPYPMDEYNAALTWSIELREDAYILPILVGDVRVPEELLSSATAHLRSEDWSVEELAKITAERVRGVVPATPPPSVASASGVLLPRIGLGGYSPLETLTKVLSLLVERFQANSVHLELYGYTCEVKSWGSATGFWLQAKDRPTYKLEVVLERSYGAIHLQVRADEGLYGAISVVARVTTEWDRRHEEVRLRVADWERSTNELLSADEFFETLWRKVVAHIEQTH